RQTADLWLAYRRGALRAHLSGHGEFDLAIWADSDQWDEPTIEAYQSQLLPREAWVAGSLGVTELTLGRQVVAWGEGRLSGVLDVVNPRDLREPGMVDLEDLRLPVSMARVTSSLDGGSVWPGTHRFELMVVPEADFGFRSSPLGPFGMLDGLVDEVELDESMAELVDLDGVLEDLEVDYVHLQDRWAADQLQSFARWTWRGRGLDLGVYAASVLDQQGTIVMPEFIDLLAASNEGESVEIGLDHRRYQLLGQSGVVAALGVLARWEVAYKNDLP
ncbi:MAG: hypothetical protein QGG40_22690, partial [Myxococcota bacterium]|nr:hypothetical protein [Myxococcota bacterium]